MAKFTIRGTQFRTLKKDLKVKMIDKDGKSKEHVVGWVTVRGQEDPVYQKRITPATVDYQEDSELIRQEIQEIKKETKEGDEPDIEIQKNKMRVVIERFMLSAVCAAIEEWDEDFFESEFSYDKAMSLFEDPSNNHIYNQIAEYIGEKDDFLPIASAEQSNG